MEYTGAIGYYVVESGLGIWGPDISTGLCIGLGLYRLYIYIIKIKNVYIYMFLAIGKISSARGLGLCLKGQHTMGWS